MKRNVLGPSLALILGMAFAIGIAGARIPTSGPHATMQGSVATLPECPHSYNELPIFHSPRIWTGANLSVPGIITNVPEFHDCQRFMIDRGGTLVFGQLMAIFASFRLDVLMDSLCKLSAPEGRRVADDPRAVQPAPRPEAVRPTTDPAGVRPPVTSPALTPPLSPRQRLCGESSPQVTAGAPGVRIPSATEQQAAAGPAIAAAEIYNFGERYDPLGIFPAFNCLYLYFDRLGRLRAKMVPVGETEVDCLKAINPDRAPGKQLALIPTFFSNNSKDYPPVARWDWDATNKEQYIGIKCGASWCEVGDPGFRPSHSYMPAPGMDSWKKVFRVKGWYDEQFLAVRPSASAPEPVPSSIKATFVPTPDLDALDDVAAFDGRWKQIGVIMVDGEPGLYRRKLNLSATPPGRPLNQVFACRGTQTACEARPADPCDPPPPGVAGADVNMWWTRVRSGEGTTQDFCVHRRGHEPKGVHIVGTTRWRWMIADETGWGRCLEGCCEVQARR